MTVTAESFRQVMRRLPAGVCILTSGKCDEIAGMTVSSLFSLSLSPPVLVVAVNTESTTYKLLARSRNFGISVPLTDHQPLLELFSSTVTRGADRFRPHEWKNGISGVPLLVEAAATVECSVQEIVTHHTHAIVLGNVKDCSVNQQSSAIAYWNGRYHGLKD